MKLQDVTFDEVIETYKRDRLDEIRAWAQDVDLPGPIQLEIGSNRGRMLKGLATLYHDRSVLGIEIRKKFADLVQAELDMEGPVNARMLCADANLALPLLFPDGGLERIYVLFPDPWWKKRHAKRRLLTPRFLHLLADKLKPGGHLILKTDVEPYADYLREVLADVQDVLQTVEEGHEDYPDDEDQWPTTTREAKILRSNLPIWRFYQVRTSLAHSKNRDAALATPAPSEAFQKPVSPDKGGRARFRSK